MELLLTLQEIPGPSGDEGEIADFLEAHCSSLPGVTVRRVLDVVIAQRGKPRVAIFAHTDTVGFTQAYERSLVSIGGPRVQGGERLKEVRGPGKARIQIRLNDGEPEWILTGRDGRPGSRWVYAAGLQVKGDQVSGPYLDNRAGVWNGVRVLERCDDVVVLFTSGEEHSGKGALLAAHIAFEDLGITRALISDITWDTDWIKNGKGPAVSHRDRSVPRRRYLEEVLGAAEHSGVRFQHEVERSGGSDGSSLDRLPYPIDWVFVGAPQKDPHTVHEVCSIRDLQAMVDLYAHLVPALSRF
jgi:putative aminopeptidase FrvX